LENIGEHPSSAITNVKSSKYPSAHPRPAS